MMRVIAVVLAGGLLLASAGCSNVQMVGHAAGMAFQAVKGADADATLIRGDFSPSRLAVYDTLLPGDVTTDVPPICDSGVLAKVRREFTETLAGEDLRKAFPGGGRALKINVLCRFFKEKGMIGGEGRLDWLVTLADNSTGEAVGVVFVEGVSESPIQHGASDMAKANAKELLKFLRKAKQGGEA
ncbi:MAG TPA: hypothetical protein PKY77_09420 [Phycisphaerae bacterium]|nr:hypothetical protein [Phycisphaerae bacterium]HRY69828.1 hypothetical protein [Phycisphaerae bacterium]HSA25445.1 hypothetical protein [Phycisphaerae bacterium]